jgi:hypothetical protein
MMGMIRETTPDAQARYHQSNTRRVYRSQGELKMREAVETWGRARWPDARVIHELVMDRGTVRADVAFVTVKHLAVVEIKSDHDDTHRLLHQAGMFRLAVPELWIASAHRHAKDAELIRYLMPTIGIALCDRADSPGPIPDLRLYVEHEAQRFDPWPEATLSLLWVDELAAEAVHFRLGMPKRSTYAKLVKAIMKLDPAEQMEAVCRQLRARNFGWRADPPIPIDLKKAA